MDALAIREFLRQSAETPGWTVKDLESLLAIKEADAKQVLATLQMAGYIEPVPGSKTKWRNTQEGNSVAKVSAAKSIKRTTAEKKLKEFIARVKQINDDNAFLYRVDKAVLFGPYLAGEERSKDIDIAISITPKERKKEKLESLVKDKVEALQAEGKHFQSFAARRHYGETEGRNFLKSGAS